MTCACVSVKKMDCTIWKRISEVLLWPLTPHTLILESWVHWFPEGPHGTVQIVGVGHLQWYNLITVLWCIVTPSLSVSLGLPRCPCLTNGAFSDLHRFLLLHILIKLSPCVSSLWYIFSLVPYSQSLPHIVVFFIWTISRSLLFCRLDCFPIGVRLPAHAFIKLICYSPLPKTHSAICQSWAHLRQFSMTGMLKLTIDYDRQNMLVVIKNGRCFGVKCGEKSAPFFTGKLSLISMRKPDGCLLCLWTGLTLSI